LALRRCGGREHESLSHAVRKKEGLGDTSRGCSSCHRLNAKRGGSQGRSDLLTSSRKEVGAKARTRKKGKRGKERESFYISRKGPWFLEKGQVLPVLRGAGKGGGG